MSRRVLRVNKRKASWEGSAEEFARTEFQDYETGGLDLRLSVYLVEPADTVRAHTEHAVSLLDTPKSLYDMDLNSLGIGTLRKSPGETAFVFANEQHHELHLENEHGVLDLARSVLEAATVSKVEVTKEAQLEYATTRLDAGDPEWEAACAAGKPGERWRTSHVPKFRRR